MNAYRTRPTDLTKAARPGSKLGPGDHANRFQVRGEQSMIQWPTKLEIQRVSEGLARIKREGIRLEVNGDYFRSGDLAYQIQEIIRATADLAKKSMRAKR